MSSLVRSSGELPTFPQYQAETEQAQQVPTVKVVGILFRRKWLILGIMALISLPAGLVILTLPSYFDAQSLLVVEFRKTEFSDLQASVSNVTGDSLVIRTQTDILMSPEMAGRVVDKLDLVQTPSVQRILSAPPTFPLSTSIFARTHCTATGRTACAGAPAARCWTICIAVCAFGWRRFCVLPRRRPGAPALAKKQACI